MPASRPEGFLFPRMVGVVGQLHPIWNAFEGACKAYPDWSLFEERLRSLCALLGRPGKRQRYFEACLQDPSLEPLFRRWRFTVVDWKWEYMES
eukprot:1897571-Alexandrium_andersonii.AAC.1